jgi:hypothetical protein
MTDVLVLEELKSHQMSLVAAALLVAGYKTVGRAPKEEGDTLAFYPEEKVMRAVAKDAPILDSDGNEVKSKTVGAVELISTIRGLMEVEHADSLANEESDGSVHEHKMVLENNEVKMVVCVHCARNFALGKPMNPNTEAQFRKDFSQDKVIRLLVGSLLNYEGLLFPNK